MFRAHCQLNLFGTELVPVAENPATASGRTAIRPTSEVVGSKNLTAEISKINNDFTGRHQVRKRMQQHRQNS
jgi:hypothetical protein